MTPTTFAIYDRSTGVVTSSGNAASKEDALANENLLSGVYLGAASIGQRIEGDTLVVPSQRDVLDKQWIFVKLKRSGLLTACDWVVIKSTESGQLVPSEWLMYRQALRDITLQGDPMNIVWPVQP